MATAGELLDLLGAVDGRVPVAAERLRRVLGGAVVLEHEDDSGRADDAPPENGVPEVDAVD